MEVGFGLRLGGDNAEGNAGYLSNVAGRVRCENGGEDAEQMSTGRQRGVREMIPMSGWGADVRMSGEEEDAVSITKIRNGTFWSVSGKRRLRSPFVVEHNRGPVFVEMESSATLQRLESDKGWRCFRSLASRGDISKIPTSIPQHSDSDHG